MTGLDLESFLLLLRADLTAWGMLGLTSLGLVLVVWVCWGSRRALRKCLVLSLAAHLGMVLFGSTVPAVQLAIRGESIKSADRSHVRRIRVAPLVDMLKSPEGGTSPTRERRALDKRRRSYDVVASARAAGGAVAAGGCRVPGSSTGDLGSSEPRPGADPSTTDHRWVGDASSVSATARSPCSRPSIRAKLNSGSVASAASDASPPQPDRSGSSVIGSVDLARRDQPRASGRPWVDRGGPWHEGHDPPRRCSTPPGTLPGARQAE